MPVELGSLGEMRHVTTLFLSLDALVPHLNMGRISVVQVAFSVIIEAAKFTGGVGLCVAHESLQYLLSRHLPDMGPLGPTMSARIFVVKNDLFSNTCRNWGQHVRGWGIRFLGKLINE